MAGDAHLEDAISYMAWGERGSIKAVRGVGVAHNIAQGVSGSLGYGIRRESAMSIMSWHCHLGQMSGSWRLE